MSQDVPLSDVERTALNVFHDLELAHTRQTDEPPTPTATQTDRTPVEAQRPTVPTGTLMASA